MYNKMNTNEYNRFELLDSIQVILATCVILQHTTTNYKLRGDYEHFSSIGALAVLWFFILSSLLLTYRFVLS